MRRPKGKRIGRYLPTEQHHLFHLLLAGGVHVGLIDREYASRKQIPKIHKKMLIGLADGDITNRMLLGNACSAA